MQITYLGHAGFCVEMPSTTIIMDPWLSRYGAFDSAWFQLPRNHHLVDLVQQKIQDRSKDRYIYISHEHKDHFDAEFLDGLIARDFTFLVPAFRRSALRDQLARSQSKGIVALTFRMRISRRPDIYQTLFQGFLIMESEDLNHFCEQLLAIESRRERLIVEAGGCRYSINRFCPHQGADLGEGWIEDGRYLVCARHRWRFDLSSGGRCDTSNTSIDAIALEDS